VSAKQVIADTSLDCLDAHGTTRHCLGDKRCRIEGVYDNRPQGVSRLALQEQVDVPCGAPIAVVCECCMAFGRQDALPCSVRDLLSPFARAPRHRCRHTVPCQTT
jgi:hypothetical protein